MSKAKIYGISSKYNFGWEYGVYAFEDMATAEQWLRTEEGDFSQRELMTKSEAISIVGRKNVEHATRVYLVDGQLAVSVYDPRYDAYTVI